MDRRYIFSLPFVFFGHVTVPCFCHPDIGVRVKWHEVTRIKTFRAMHNETFSYIFSRDNQITLRQEGGAYHPYSPHHHRPFRRFRGRSGLYQHSDQCPRGTDRAHCAAAASWQAVLITPGYLGLPPPVCTALIEIASAALAATCGPRAARWRAWDRRR